MLIYIDKDFAIEFETWLLKGDAFQNPDHYKAHSRLFEMFREYPQLEVYSDATQEEKNGIRLFRYITNLNAFIRTKDQFLFELNKTTRPLHLLAFTSKRHDWADQFEQIGGLYYTGSDYLVKISEIISFEKSIRFTELKKTFAWNDIGYISCLPANKAFITDNYLIISKGKRNANLKPILRILSKIETPNFVFELFVNEDKLGWNKNDWDNFDEEMENFLSEEDLNVEIRIKRYSIRKGNSRYNFHDRKLFLKYIKVEVGKGFDLLPYDQNTISDKKVVVGTIFSKDTYDDFRNYFVV
jgi:hypothetical protein